MVLVRHSIHALFRSSVGRASRFYREGPGSESQRDHKPLLQEAAIFMPYTYILFSAKLNKYYIGACIDIDRRLYEHNLGHSKFTSTGIPWLLMYKEYYETLPDAKKREAFIKRMKSRKYIENLINGTGSP